MSKLEDEKFLYNVKKRYIIEKYFLRKGMLQMKKLYGTILIHKQIMEKQNTMKENINYYKLKDKKYGIEIVKENEEKEKLEITNLINVTDNEEAINYLLSTLVKKKIMPSESDVIHDLVKQYC